MATNLLQYSLGLATEAFRNAVSGAMGSLTQFMQQTLSLGNIQRQIWSAIEGGSSLDVLARRTGVAAGEIYRLRRAFEDVGANAEEVPGILNRMQKALAGADEMGNKTADAFERLGLDMDDLQKAGGAQAFQTILQAMGQLGQGEALNLGMKIFGRMGASDVALLLNSTTEFTRSMTETKGMGDFWTQMAKPFFDLRLAWREILDKVEDFWGKVASGLVPALRQVVDLVGGIDFDKPAQQIREMLLSVTALLQSGHVRYFFELLFEVLRTNLTRALVGAITEAAAAAVPIILNIVPKLAEAVSTAMRAQLGGVMGTLLAPAGLSILSSAGTLQRLGFGGAGGIEGATGAGEALRDLLARFLGEGGLLGAGEPRSLRSGLANLAGGGIAGGTGDNRLNELQRMGAIFSGVGLGTDYAQQTAQNTKRIAEILDEKNNFGGWGRNFNLLNT